MEDFLSNLEEIPTSLKDAFGQEDITEYNAHLEAARIESLRVAKAEKKHRKEEAHTKLAHEARSSAALTVTRGTHPDPTICNHMMKTQIWIQALLNRKKSKDKVKTMCCNRVESNQKRHCRL